QVAGLFLPWSDANARAIAEAREEFSVELAGGRWTQKPQKYHAKSLAELRRRYAEVADAELDAVLGGCLRWLKSEGGGAGAACGPPPLSAQPDPPRCNRLEQLGIQSDEALSIEEVQRVRDLTRVPALAAVVALLLLEGAGDAHLLAEEPHEVGPLVGR